VNIYWAVKSRKALEDEFVVRGYVFLLSGRGRSCTLAACARLTFFCYLENRAYVERRNGPGALRAGLAPLDGTSFA